MKSKPYKVLIIDDSAADRRIYRRFLLGQQRFELEVFEAETAEDGLKAFAKLIPDCVILDYRLPDLDGLAVLDALQERAAADHTKRRVPVIFVTGKPEALLLSEAYRRGVAKYISKDTITSASILDAVADALESN
ncbi:MAG TPA: response regulator [Cellvibrio sp.]|nr:response regulator [Cellvibrio sp.]